MIFYNKQDFYFQVKLSIKLFHRQQIFEKNICSCTEAPEDDVRAAHLDAPVMRPHLVLHSVLLEDVNGLQQGQFVDVFGRLKSGQQ